MRKSEALYWKCREEIAAMAPGSPVPSVRELMRRFEVSQVTVTRAMRRLQQEGLVDARIGSGSVRAGNRPAAAGGALRIGLLLPDYPSTFMQALRRSMAERFAARGYAPDISYFSDSEFHRGKLKIKSNLDALILDVHQNFTPQLVEQLSSLTIPLVCLDVIPQGLNFDAVSADNAYGGIMAADWFVRNGHSRTGMLMSQPHSSTAEARMRGFKRQMQLSGLAPVIIDAQTPEGENSTASAYRAFRNHVEERGLDFTALFCDSDLGSLGVLRACRELNIDVPGDLSVIGFDNIPECEYFHPALSSIDQCLDQWAVEVESIIRERREGARCPVIQRYITPVMILRESTAVMKKEPSRVSV